MTTVDPVQRRAMACGLAAIGLWGALAALSVLAGAIPPFQMVAMTFTVGASLGIVRARRRGVGWGELVRWPARVWLLGIAGLFGYHALYFGALQLAPPAEANLVNYLWPLLIVLLSAPFAADNERGRLAWTHLAGAGLGFAGVALLAFGRGIGFSADHALGYGLALGCAVTWALYSVLSRRFGETPTDAIAAFCAASALLSLLCHLVFERTVWPASTAAGLAVLALGIGPAGGAFYLYPRAPGGSGAAFAERAVADEKLIVVPGKVFGAADTHFRIAYTTDDSTLDRGIEALKRLATSISPPSG